MPRPNPLRPIGREVALARRIAYERERRAWSYEGLAERMNRAGCPIHASAIYKIEKNKPPRRITVDEMAAFAEVFGVSIGDLLTPLGVLASERAQEIHVRFEQAYDDLAAAADRLLDIYRDAAALAVSLDPQDVEAAQSLLKLLTAPTSSGELRPTTALDEALVNVVSVIGKEVARGEHREEG